MIILIDFQFMQKTRFENLFFEHKNIHERYTWENLSDPKIYYWLYYNQITIFKVQDAKVKWRLNYYLKRWIVSLCDSKPLFSYYNNIHR